MNELKPCPFCGSEDLYTKQHAGMFSIECNECVAEGPPNTTGIHAAIAAWNKRYIPDLQDWAEKTLGVKMTSAQKLLLRIFREEGQK